MAEADGVTFVSEVPSFAVSDDDDDDDAAPSLVGT